MAYRSGITENVNTVILPETFSQISGIVNQAAFLDRVAKVLDSGPAYSYVRPRLVTVVYAIWPSSG